MRRHDVVGLLLLLLLVGVDGKRSEKTINTGKNWIFLDKFCFLKSGAHLDLDFKWINTPSSSAQINLYVDTDSSWPVVYKHRKDWSCEQLANSSQASFAYGSSPLTVNVWGARDRWWFVTASDCGSTSGINMWYKLHFVNPDTLSDEFSADEIGILPETIVFFCVFVLLGVWTIYGWIVLKWKKHQYAITKRLMVAVVIECVALLFYLIHWSVYAGNGKGVDVLKRIAEFLSICSEMVFLLVIIFLAKGYKISGRHLTYKRLILLAWIPFPVAYFAFYLYGQLGLDPALTLYVWETPPGYVIIALHLVAMAVFCFVLQRTFRIERSREKKVFYVIFGLFYCLWFANVPIVVLIVSFIGAWLRSKIVFAVEYSIKFLSYAFLSILFCPPPLTSRFVKKMSTDIAFDNPLQVFPDK